MTDAMRVRCLGEELTEYAAARLPLERQWAWDRHLVACQLCAHAVDQERRLRSVLAGAPSMPGDLRSSLLALGTAMAADAGPRAVPATHGDPLRLLSPDAPACHRSALRATVVAAAAAGVSAAAAWSLTVVPAPARGAPALATTVPVASPAAAPSRTAATPRSSTSPTGLAQTDVLSGVVQRAQSSP